MAKSKRPASAKKTGAAGQSTRGKRSAKAVRERVSRGGASTKEAPVAPARAARRARATVDVRHADPALFAPLSEGERADALRTLLEDERLRGLAKVGRYRVITVEPLAVKPPDPLAGRRLARLVIYDYAGDRCVDAAVDLDRGAVGHVRSSAAQPMLSRDEEREAMAIAEADERVRAARVEGDEASAALHYWSLRQSEFAYRRRAAAVLFARPNARPHLVAVVSLLDGEVVEVAPAGGW